MTEAVSISTEKAVAIRLGRWWQLSLGVICMSMIANLQYGWTLFVNPIHDEHGWSLSAIQVAFTIFVLVETWLVPIEGYLVDRIGPTYRRRRGGRSRRRVVGDQLRSPTRCRCSTSAPSSAASARARCTARASATRSSGFPTGADSPRDSPRWDSARDRR